MRTSLALKLTLAFAALGLVVVLAVAVFARITTVQRFDRLRVERAQNNFVAVAASYFEEHGSWVGAVAVLRPPRPQPGEPEPVPFILAKQDGVVVVPGGPFRVGERLPATMMKQGAPVVVDGDVVGRALLAGAPPPREPVEQTYVAHTDRALVGAGLAAIVIALLLGAVLARTLTRPLRELTRATEALAQGDLEQQVSIRSQDELGELASSFNQMSAALAQANQSRRQMTADIAHDLRTPLAVIRGYTEALRDGDLPPTPETFQIMYQEAEHLNRLVDDLRTLSLVDAGELALNRQPILPRELLERTAAAYAPQAEQVGIGLHVQNSAHLPPVSVDPERLAQVLGNLVTNAIRYTPSGGRITLAAGRHDSQVYLSVHDTGAGIAPEDLPRVFDRFYRGDSARQSDEGQSGLGLAIAKSLVELHGGTIAAQSVLGSGSAFTIYLPAG